MRARLILSVLAALVLTSGTPARAQTSLLPSLFPEGVPGYDAAPGVTVRSRLHPDQAQLGLRDGPLHIFPSLDESLGFDSNPLPSTGQHGSWQITTAPMLILGTDWSRNQLGAAVTARNTTYASLPSQNRTDGSGSAGGRLDIGQDQLTVGAAYTASHENRSAIDTIASDKPIAFQVGDLRAAYRVVDGRWSLTPALDVSSWTYDNTTVGGQPSSQSYRDRDVADGSVTFRYDFAPLRSALVVVRAVGQNYTSIPIGQPTTNSQSYQILAGFDYDADAVWRWRVLLGGESRQFTASAYHPRNTLIAEAETTWFPTGLTTVSASLTRDTEDAAQEGVSGLVYTAARLTIDHEYFRNLLLHASASLQQADYFQGGRQSGYAFGLGATWVLNRSVRMSLTYDQIDLRGGQSTSQTLSTGYNRGLGLLTFHFDL